MNANWCYLVRCGWQWEHIETRHDYLLMEYTQHRHKHNSNWMSCQSHNRGGSSNGTIGQPAPYCRRTMTDANQISFTYFISFLLLFLLLCAYMCCVCVCMDVCGVVFILLLVACSFFPLTFDSIQLLCCECFEKVVSVKNWQAHFGNTRYDMYVGYEIWFIYCGLLWHGQLL